LIIPAWQRSFWAIVEGVVAATLLIAGGLSALQAMTIASALPFAIIMLIAAVGMWRALVIEGHTEASLQAHMQRAHRGGAAVRGRWKKRLAELVQFPSRDEVDAFIESRVVGAMKHVQRELDEQGWPADIFYDQESGRAYIEVIIEGQIDFIYDIRMCEYLVPSFAYPEIERDEESAKHYYRAEVFLRRGGQSYDIYGYDQQEVIDDILDQFEKYLHFLHVSPGSLPWKMQEHDEMLNPPEDEVKTSEKD
jgi:choline/glycine/proline betaine transport protein